MGSLSPTHWLIVLGVLVLLFGAKKLPDMARSVGQSARVLKGELNGLKDDDPAPPPVATTAAAPVRHQGEPARPDVDLPNRTAVPGEDLA